MYSYIYQPPETQYNCDPRYTVSLSYYLTWYQSGRSSAALTLPPPPPQGVAISRGRPPVFFFSFRRRRRPGEINLWAFCSSSDRSEANLQIGHASSSRRRSSSRQHEAASRASCQPRQGNPLPVPRRKSALLRLALPLHHHQPAPALAAAI